MTDKPGSDLPTSVRHRLLNVRQVHGEDYNSLLTQHAIERFLYRLSKSELSRRFVLKGAMPFRVWSGACIGPRRIWIYSAMARHLPTRLHGQSGR